MVINRKLLLDTLGLARLGLAPKEIAEQTCSFIFLEDRVATYNDVISMSVPLPLGIRGVVPAKQLYALLGKTPGMDLEVTAEDGALVITGNTGMTARVGMDSEVRLPIDMVPSAEDDLWLPLDEGFNERLMFCLQTVLTNFHRPALRSVYWKENMLESSDNYRISRCTTNTFLPDGIGVAIEYPAVSELVKFDPASYQVANGWIHFRSRDAVVFSCRFSSDPFPDIDALLGGAYVSPIKFSPRLPKILDRALTFAGKDSSDDFVAEVSIVNNRLTVRAEQGFLQFEESCGVHCAEDIKFRVNPEFLKKMLNDNAEAALLTKTGDEELHLLRLERDGFTRFLVIARDAQTERRD